MPFDPSGNFTRSYNFVDDKANGIKVVADRMDGEFDNFATGMNQVFLRNGVAAMSGNVNMGSNSITALASGSASNPAIRLQADPATGLFSPGVGKVSLSAGGTQRLEANTTGVKVNGNFDVSGATVLAGATTFSGAVTYSQPQNMANGLYVGAGTFTAGTTSLLQARGSMLLESSALNALGFNTYPLGAVWTQSLAGYAGAIRNNPASGGLQFCTSPASVGANAPNSLTEHMRLTPAGQLAIGATSPAAKLHVIGSSTVGTQAQVSALIGTGGANNLLLGSENGVRPFIGSEGAAPLLFFTNGTEAARFDAAGNFGVGTQVPVNVAGYYSMTVNGATGSIVSVRQGGAEMGRLQGTASDFRVNGVANVPVRFFANNTEYMRINPTGEIGLGVVNPQANVHMNGVVRISGTTLTRGIEFYDTGATNYGGIGTSRWIDSTGDDMSVVGAVGRGVRIYTNGTESARFDVNNNLGLGTTAPPNYPGNATYSANGTSGGIFAGMVNGVTVGRLIFSGADVTLQSEGAQNVVLRTNSISRLVINPAGLAYFPSDQAPTNKLAVGYLGVPQSGTTSKTANYTAVLNDAGEHITFNGSNLTGTIPSNASVAYPIGTTLTFVNLHATNLSIAIATDTLRQAGTPNTGTRSLPQYGMATALKVSSTIWLISGTELA